ncbi:MAG: hypothetical protein J5756_03565, partial [Clostridia bacterium]|nr:hypothetical protein [Clostridia bacterium]
TGALTYLTHPNATADVAVADCIIVDDTVTPVKYKINVLVGTEGVQSRGFANAAAATNSAFGDFSTLSAADATAHFDAFWN